MRKLSTVIGRYPQMQPLRDGRIRSDLVQLEFVDFPAVGAAFDNMILDQRYDVCEMALIAFMQARAQSTPIWMLPVVALGGLPFGSIYYNPSYGPLSPFELSDKRIGVRSYSQTTTVWLRAALAEQFGLDIGKASWIATGGAHVPGFEDPPNVRNLGTAEPVENLLLAGAVDAAIVHPTRAPVAEFDPLIPDPDRAAAQWFDRHRIVPINHVICVAPSVWREPELVAEVYSMFDRSYRAAGVAEAEDRLPLSYGLPQIMRAIDVASRLAVEQRLIPAAFNAADAVLNP